MTRTRKIALCSLGLTMALVGYAAGPGRPVYDQISLRIALRSPTLVRTMTLLTGTMACYDNKFPDNVDGGSTDGGTGTRMDAAKPIPEAGPTGSDVGKECTSSAQCTLGDMPGCSSIIGSTSPGACVDSCTPTPNSTTVEGCANDKGVCVPTQGGGICLQACQFDETGLTVKCGGKESCSPYAFGKDSMMKPIGIGICFGGCKADTDCTTGTFCDTASGRCEAKKTTYTKNVGEACDRTAAPAQCACRAQQSAPTMGVCGQTCATGAAGACGAGFYCAAVPAKDRMGMPLFTVEPVGLEGNCQKECAGDTECLNGQKCVESPGGKKTCDFP
jgi:hypothetical protein